MFAALRGIHPYLCTPVLPRGQKKRNQQKSANSAPFVPLSLFLLIPLDGTVAFSWLFCGLRAGLPLCVLDPEQSSDQWCVVGHVWRTEATHKTSNGKVLCLPNLEKAHKLFSHKLSVPPFVPGIVPGISLCKIRRKPGCVPSFHRICPRDKPGEIPATNPGSSQDQPDKKVYVYVPFSCLPNQKCRGGVGGERGLARGNPSSTIDSGLFPAPFSCPPYEEGATISGELIFCCIFGPVGCQPPLTNPFSEP